MIVPANPLPALLGSNASPSTFEERQYFHSTFGGANFYSRARWALLDGLVQLGCKPGDSIAVPAFFCESTLLPLKGYGFNLVFVDVEVGLQTSVKTIVEILRENRIDALLLVNYFGIGVKARNDVINVCHAQNVRVIEDCSHSFLSYLFTRKDSDADMYIFSIRKTLAVADGGALVLGRHINSNLEIPKESGSILQDLTFLVKRYLEAIVIKIGWPNLYGARIDWLKAWLSRLGADGGDSVRIRVDNYEVPPPSFSLLRYLSDKDYLSKISKKRVCNYQKLAAAIAQFELSAVFPDISSGDVPQVLPVCDPTGTLVAYLRKKGVGAYRWPGDELPDKVRSNPALYPHATSLNEAIVCLPIHQDINDKHISFMKDVIADWSKALLGGG